VRITSERIDLVKRHPLTISRGTSAGSTNVVVSVEHEGVVGIGEMAPSEVTEDSAASAESSVAEWVSVLEPLHPTDTQRIESLLGPVGRTGSAIRAALDMACFDWLGKRADLPVWRILGLDPTRIVPTSLTIGINPTEVIRERVPEILTRTKARVLKVKLGQPAGIEADQAMFTVVQESARSVDVAEPAWRVDANCGWTLADAKTMIPWLADRGVTYVEQPLAEGDDDSLLSLFRSSELPIYADESIHSASDVANLADRLHGVNLKLMKCGGITGALRIINTARAHGLSVMIGCMGESSLAISAGAQIGSLCDHIDLDSHLNLLNDPFVGATYTDGRVLPNDLAGLGVRWAPAESTNQNEVA
jgi:L-Ala-D/L-Glu epimerase